MQIRVLGHLEASVDDRPLALGGAKQRAVLAMLVLEANRTVSAERLIAGLWDEAPPASAAKMLQTYVWRLRTVLGEDSGATILTHGRGYELRVDPQVVDVCRLERLVSEAGRAGGRGSAAHEAVALFRGDPLADLAEEPFAAAEIRRLEELRDAAAELALDADLAAGRHQEVIGEIMARLAENPLRERLHALRMLALYRCGRQAEALEAFRQARRALVEEIGVEPGRELRQLHDAILRQDPSLDVEPVVPELPRERDAEPARRVVDPASELIGREREQAALRECAERLSDGPAAILLAGEAGMGKTTLWRAAVETAHASGHRVLVARPSAAEARLGFAGLRDLLEDAAAEILDAVPGPQADALRVALLLERPRATGVDQPVVAASFLSALRVLSGRRPVLIAIDDVQWLDAPSAAVVGFAWRRMRTERVGLLLAHRVGEPLPPGLGSVEGVPQVAVGPLGVSAVGELLRRRLGLRFPAPTLRRLHTEAGGNPFFALELGPAFDRHREQLAAGAPAPVPERLLDLVADRVSALPEPTREALAAAAALSQPTPALVAAVLDGEESLRPAFAARVLELDGDRLRFSHPLLAAAAYEALDPLARRDMHRRLATVVPDVDEGAHHLALATTEPDAVVADALERAADHAFRRGASAMAAELYEHAHRVTPPNASGDRHRRIRRAGRHHWTAGDIARGRALLETAVAEAPSSAARAEALTRLGWVCGFEGDQPRAAELARRALAERDAALGVRAEAEVCLSAALSWMGEELEEAARCAARAADLAARCGDVLRHNDGLCMLGLVAGLRGDRSADDFLRAAADQGEEAAGWRVNGWPSKIAAYVALRTDRHHAAVAAFRRLTEQAVERGDEASLPDVLSSLAFAEYLAGRWQQAERTATAAFDVALTVGERPFQASALAVRARIEAATGRDGQARDDAAAALDLIGERGMVMARIDSVSALALLDLMHGRAQDAADRLRPLRERLLAGGVGEPAAMGFVADEVEAMVTLSRHAEAVDLVEWLEERGAALDRASALAAAARGRGMLAAAGGDQHGAITAFERAVTEHDRAATPFERARTLLHLAAAQRRAKDKGAARTTLSEALPIFEGLGAGPWQAQAAGELASISDGHP